MLSLFVQFDWFLKQAMKSDWSLRFVKAISLTGKKMLFRANSGAIRE